MNRDRSAGLFVGITIAFFLSSLMMVQLRCKFSAGFPCGDWPRHGYTWHFWPAFFLVLGLWLALAKMWSHRTSRSYFDALRLHGDAAGPMLGLVIAWAWYGLVGPEWHRPACTVPLLCHDTVPFSIAIWSFPWIAWGAWRIRAMWRR